MESSAVFLNDCMAMAGNPILDDPLMPAQSNFPIPSSSTPFLGMPSVWAQVQDTTIDPTFAQLDAVLNTGSPTKFDDNDHFSLSPTTPTTQFSSDNSASTKASSNSRASRRSAEKKMKRSRKSKEAAAVAAAASAIKMEPGDDVPQEKGTRRTKFLERNRIAASKCRQKKKEWILELEEKRLGLEHAHSTLQGQFNELLSEVSQIKNELMAHADCNDHNINQWIGNEARKFVQSETRRFSQASTISDHLSLGSYGQLVPSDDTQSDGSPQSATFNYDHMTDSMFDPEMA